MGDRAITGRRWRVRLQCPDHPRGDLPGTASSERPERQQLPRSCGPDPLPQRLPSPRCRGPDLSPRAHSLPYVSRRQHVAAKQRQRPNDRPRRKQPAPQHLGGRNDHHRSATPAPKPPLHHGDLARCRPHLARPPLLPLPHPVSHERQRLSRALACRPAHTAPRRSHRLDRRNTACPKLDTQPRMYQSLNAQLIQSTRRGMAFENSFLAASILSAASAALRLLRARHYPRSDGSAHFTALMALAPSAGGFPSFCRLLFAI